MSGRIFSKRLHDLMEWHHVTQKALAEEIEVSQGMISRWLNGAVPRADKLQAIAKFFNTSTDRLLSGIDFSQISGVFGEVAERAAKVQESADPGNEAYQQIMEAEAQAEKKVQMEIAAKLKPVIEMLASLVEELEAGYKPGGKKKGETMKYWLYEGDQVVGPYSLADIQQMIDRGLLKGEDRVCRNGETEWKDAGEMREFDFSTAKSAKIAEEEKGPDPVRVPEPVTLPAPVERQTATGLLAAIILGLIGFAIFWVILTHQ